MEEDNRMEELKMETFVLILKRRKHSCFSRYTFFIHLVHIISLPHAPWSRLDLLPGMLPFIGQDQRTKFERLIEDVTEGAIEKRMHKWMCFSLFLILSSLSSIT